MEDTAGIVLGDTNDDCKLLWRRPADHLVARLQPVLCVSGSQPSSKGGLRPSRGRDLSGSAFQRTGFKRQRVVPQQRTWLRRRRVGTGEARRLGLLTCFGTSDACATAASEVTESSMLRGTQRLLARCERHCHCSAATHCHGYSTEAWAGHR